MKNRRTLRDRIQECRSRGKSSSRNDLVTSWKEKELWDGELQECFTVIFRTKGCSWSRASGCSMCGYYTDTNPEMDEKWLKKQLEETLSRYDGEKMVKIYTSGSFLDENEIPVEYGEEILSAFDSEKTLIESRPEFVEDDILKRYGTRVNELEIALGLESARDFVLDHCINKGFHFDDYREACEKIKEKDIDIRTYLLFKPPFLTEKEAIDDILHSIEEISDLTDIISINPCNVQKGSLVDRLWRRNIYRPPWLWSILEIISRMESDNPIIFSKAGLGSERGGHNCGGGCEEKIIDLIEEFNLTQRMDDLEKIRSTVDCGCYEEWCVEKRLEPYLSFRGSIDILGDRYTGYI